MLHDAPPQYATYSIDKGNFYTENIRISQGRYAFDFVGAGIDMRDVALGIAGHHNVENAVAAIGAALRLGIDVSHIRQALMTFRGVKRRFEYIIKNNDCVLIDDYAHHPAEITALLQSVRALYPGRKITVIFQPHLYSRTRDFAEGFAESLSLADAVILLPIYPARELPIEGVDSALIFNKMTMDSKECVSDDALIDVLRTKEIDILLTVGAGDIDAMVPRIAELLNKGRNA